MCFVILNNLGFEEEVLIMLRIVFVCIVTASVSANWIQGCQCGSQPDDAPMKETENQPDDTAIEAIATLKSFKAVFRLIDESMELADERDDCAFGPNRYVEGDGTMRDENPSLRACMNRCLSKRGNKQTFDCYGKCWAAVGGKETPEERIACNADYLNKLELLNARALSEAGKLHGCPREMFLAFSGAVESAKSAQMLDGVTAFPVESMPRGTTIKSMESCIERQFLCRSFIGDARPCTAIQLGGILGLNGGAGAGARNIKVTLRDGRELDTSTLRLK